LEPCRTINALAKADRWVASLEITATTLMESSEFQQAQARHSVSALSERVNKSKQTKFKQVY